MLLTRSIRRKLAVSLGVLLLMLGCLAGAGLSGLASYQSLVKQLEVAVKKAPRQSELLAAIGRLSEPLGIQLPAPEERGFATAARRQSEEMARTVEGVRVEVADYFRRLREFHGEDDAPLRTASPLNTEERLYRELAEMRREAAALATPAKRDASVVYIADRQTKMHNLVSIAADPINEVLPMLGAARHSYRVRYWLVSVSLAAAVGLLAFQVYLGYRWVYVPVRRLHGGARAVAEGRYDTRITLHSSDEMGDLAKAFNRMTERFERVLEDRDREIAERSRQLVQSARLADVGFLSAGIAHEVNNPLAAVGMAAEGLEWRMDDLLAWAVHGGMDESQAEPIREYLAMIQTESARVRELTQKMLDFARRDPAADNGQRNRYDVTAIVREVIGMVGHMKRYAAHAIDFPETRPIHAVVAAGQIKQVVLNVTANALDAMNESRPEGGTLTIAVRECPDTLELSFRDEGTGMDAATIEHLFDPFFTTKTGEAGGVKGTGLGLAISHRIAADHGGVLEAESEGEGRGSTFRLRLPKAVEARRAA